MSLTKFGIAGTVIVNTDLMLIDGNSRLEKEIEKKSKFMWVSFPSRKLMPKEFKEMCAMYDFAVAGDIDLEEIDKDLGTEKSFFEDWNRDIPKALLANMGKGAPVDLAYPDEVQKDKNGKPMPTSDIRMIQVFFSSKQEKQFREMEEVIKKKFKVGNTTDVVFKAMLYATKGR